MTDAYKVSEAKKTKHPHHTIAHIKLWYRPSKNLGHADSVTHILRDRKTSN